MYRVFGNPWSNFLRLERQLVKRVFKFGFWMQINALTAVINLETDRIILGTFVSVVSAGYYELGNKLAALARILPATLLAPLLPAASAFDGRQDGSQLNRMYVRGTRYLALTTFVLSGFLIGAGPQILQVWMGRSYPYVTIVMAALLVSFAVNNMTGVGTTIVRATAQPYYETYYAVVGAVINIAATLVLTPIFGLMGVVMGTVIGQVCGSLYFLWLFHRLRGLDWRSTMIEWLWRLTLGTCRSFADFVGRLPHNSAGMVRNAFAGRRKRRCSRRRIRSGFIRMPVDPGFLELRRPRVDRSVETAANAGSGSQLQGSEAIACASRLSIRCMRMLPGGGGKVVHEYANYLARRGHTVNIIFPCPSEVDADLKTLRYRARERGDWWKARTSATVRRLMGKSALRWMPLDPRIDLYFLPSLDSRLIPDSDAIFATYWQTAEAMEKYPSNKGTKFYLIQHYETWAAPRIGSIGLG